MAFLLGGAVSVVVLALALHQTRPVAVAILCWIAKDIAQIAIETPTRI